MRPGQKVHLSQPTPSDTFCLKKKGPTPPPFLETIRKERKNVIFSDTKFVSDIRNSEMRVYFSLKHVMNKAVSLNVYSQWTFLLYQDILITPLAYLS